MFLTSLSKAPGFINKQMYSSFETGSTQRPGRDCSPPRDSDINLSRTTHLPLLDSFPESSRIGFRYHRNQPLSSPVQEHAQPKIDAKPEEGACIGRKVPDQSGNRGSPRRQLPNGPESPRGHLQTPWAQGEQRPAAVCHRRGRPEATQNRLIHSMAVRGLCLGHVQLARTDCPRL